MNIKAMLQDQKELDSFIIAKKELKEVPVQNIALAAMAEISECLNAWERFKHWKANPWPTVLDMRDVDGKPQQYNPLMDEWADIMHFALSIFNSCYRFGLVSNDSVYSGDIDSVQAYIDTLKSDGIEKDKKTVANQFVDVMNAAMMVYRSNGENYTTLLLEVIALGIDLGYNTEQLSKFYYDKHAINIKRQQSNY